MEQPTILIVDDSLTVRMDLVEAVESVGLIPVPCATLADARVALRDLAIALVLLDVRLPDGDGVTLLGELRATERGAGLPVVMLSSEAEVKDRVRGLKTGATDYVGKPYDRALVCARILELVGVAAAPRVRRSVLVIDDSPTFRNALRDLLAGAGYDVLTAEDGGSGLRAAALRRPDAVIVDGVMPDMDGGTVIRRIRLDPALRTTPCLLLTGSDGDGAELRALADGADAFARKQADPEVVLARLSAMLRHAVPGDPQPRARVPKRILAVDDSPAFLRGVADELREDGYDVVTASSGADAIELLAVQPVDCILLDREMPGLDGCAVSRRIKSAPAIRDTPVVMLSAAEDPAAMITGLAAGADDFIVKGAGIEVIKARVHAQVRRKQVEDERRSILDRLMRGELAAAEDRAARQRAEERARFSDELERKNRELEAFSYSVSHDLRAPLRAIDGFSYAILDELGAELPPRALDYLRRTREATARMGELIEDLLELSKVGRAELRITPVDVSGLATSVTASLGAAAVAAISIQPGLAAPADARLLRVVFENVLGNAVKFTAKVDPPHITVGFEIVDEIPVCVVRDNGAGFDPAHAARLFTPFQRLHSEREFAGTGIGLATVARIVDRHGGRVWATGAVNRGAAVHIALPGLALAG